MVCNIVTDHQSCCADGLQPSVHTVNSLFLPLHCVSRPKVTISGMQTVCGIVLLDWKKLIFPRWFLNPGSLSGRRVPYWLSYWALTCRRGVWWMFHFHTKLGARGVVVVYSTCLGWPSWYIHGHSLNLHSVHSAPARFFIFLIHFFFHFGGIFGLFMMKAFLIYWCRSLMMKYNPKCIAK